MDRADEWSVETEVRVPVITRSQEWLSRADRVIPSHSQTFSKGPSQWVRGFCPSYLARGEGPYVWDVDGNRYLDYVMALGSVILGYGAAEIAEAVKRQALDGANFSMMHPLEVIVAEKICRLVPCAEKVRFGKNGSDATSGMVRAARAFTGRDRIACSGYHGWQDWYIGTTSRHRGVPKVVRELTHTFDYNDIESLQQVLEAHPGEFALVLLEPFNLTPPKENFLAAVQDLAHRHGALLGFDEVITGFRIHPGGAQALFGVTPDMAAFGKAMANGLPISCVAGRRDVMDIFDDIFFSFTFAGETVSLAAANVFLDLIADGTLLKMIGDHGQDFKQRVKALIAENSLDDVMEVMGHGAHWVLTLKSSDEREGRLWRSFFIQECTRRGYLFFGSHNPTRAHDQAAMDLALGVYREVFPLFQSRRNDKTIEKAMDGQVIDPIFRVHR
jgi:glutamate-1-semialdehyde 2,1-aminomutase